MVNEKVIFTIGRTNGSGGREIAEALAKRLGVRSYDNLLITETAKAAGITEEQVYEKEEKEGKGLFSFYGISVSNPLHQYQFDAIRRLADNDESCVFVGRCADYVLAHYPDIIKVFIHASHESCVERSAKRNGITPKEAAARVKRKNQERAMYYQRYTGMVWGNAENYDLCIDTTAITIEQATELIISYAEMRGYSFTGVR